MGPECWSRIKVDALILLILVYKDMVLNLRNEHYVGACAPCVVHACLLGEQTKEGGMHVVRMLEPLCHPSQRVTGVANRLRR